MTSGASSSSLTPLTLQAVAGILLLAVVLALLALLLYLLLAGSVAWALMLLQGLMWLAFQGLRRSWTALRAHVRRVAPAAADVAAEAVPDVFLRPTH